VLHQICKPPAGALDVTGCTWDPSILVANQQFPSVSAVSAVPANEPRPKPCDAQESKRASQWASPVKQPGGGGGGAHGNGLAHAPARRPQLGTTSVGPVSNFTLHKCHLTKPYMPVSHVRHTLCLPGSLSLCTRLTSALAGEGGNWGPLEASPCCNLLASGSVDVSALCCVHICNQVKGTARHARLHVKAQLGRPASHSRTPVPHRC